MKDILLPISVLLLLLHPFERDFSLAVIRYDVFACLHSFNVEERSCSFRFCLRELLIQLHRNPVKFQTMDS